MAVDPSLSEPEVQPNPGAIRAIGILNIIFGGLQILGGLFLIAMALGLPALQKMINEVQARQTVRDVENLQRVIDDFSDQEAAEANEDNRVNLRKERRDFERQKRSLLEPRITVGLGLFNDRKVQSYSVIDGMITLTLSSLLMVSGIGLLRQKPWGRSLAIWASALRIPILIGSTAYFVVEVAPIMARLWTEDIRQMISTYAEQAGLDPAPILAQINADLISYTETIESLYVMIGIGMGALSLIYPSIVLVLLSRPGVRAALRTGEAKEDPLRSDAASPPAPPAPVRTPEGAAMVTDRGVKLAPGFALPTPQPARTIGILNIVFGSILAFYSSTSLISLLFMLVYAPGMEIQERVIDTLVAAVHEVQIEEMEGHLEVAENDVEREMIQQELQALIEAGPQTPAGFAMLSMGFQLPALTYWSWADSTTSILFNSLMIVAGVGLLRLRSWGRSLGLWVAGLKIVRLVVIWGLWILVVTPEMAEQLGNTVDEMMAQQGGPGPPPGMFKMMYAVMYSAMGVAMILLGSIYPAIVIWLLRKPGVKAACRPADRTPEEGFLP
ncbi:hypothetical protein BH23PLA1_BH23PLA1_07750 [soil metagenome]